MIVLDGWGIRAERENNAIALARTPVYDELLARYPNAQLIASGEAVGLPAGQMGNSEVGHTNMGAGRVVYQDLTRIDKSIRDGELVANPVLVGGHGPLRRRRTARCTSSASSPTAASTAISAICTRCWQMAARRGVPRVFVHAITDGRDTSPTGGVRYIGELRSGDGTRSAPGGWPPSRGRYYAMDRDKRWERTKLAWDAIVRRR